ncbi:putative short-chain dehydrogenases/reductase [Xylariales sp. PMI_506]|nr:putative short-chain dehydrogenases/reductase [Xylariales sp. PMI_506]
MVAYSEIEASNKLLASTFPDGLVAVFIGGTSGVGEYTLQAFAKNAANPRAYIVGRSEESANRIIHECEQLNPSGKFVFIKGDVSLISGVDEVCRQIKAKETAINILIMTQGSVAFDKKTSEGVPIATSLAVYSRLRFVLNLIPLIRQAPTFRRIVSVLAATCEGDIDIRNIRGEGLPLLKWRNQTAALQSLLLERVSRENATQSGITLIHAFPGLVKSGITRDARGFQAFTSKLMTLLLSPLIATPPAESGERHLFLATSARYPPLGSAGEGSLPAGVLAGVQQPSTTNGSSIDIARGSDGQVGSGLYSIDHKGESASPRVEQVLARYLEDGTSDKVWDYIMSDMKNISGSETISW